MESQSLRCGAALVVFAHPGNQLPVGVNVSKAVREAFVHRGVQGAYSILDEVVHDERGHAVGLEGDRGEAAVDQLNEQLVPDAREGRFQMRRLTDPQEVT
ncbi:hypothetical protein Atai01_80620 [Amycolatopsis taiwanensis]|uniref:Uncharacterized protein n=1 Tax=Amycolatopsis taiwanensis TaxID=342230 RepID=A0A9W6R9K4_9PSEU|nr:hypothetical protein Atai01_80620 [Amycolatopsis taiwanensis]